MAPARYVDVSRSVEARLVTEARAGLLLFFKVFHRTKKYSWLRQKYFLFLIFARFHGLSLSFRPSWEFPASVDQLCVQAKPFAGQHPANRSLPSFAHAPRTQWCNDETTCDGIPLGNFIPIFIFAYSHGLESFRIFKRKKAFVFL